MTTHSRDLRQRIINYGLVHPVRQTAELFQVSPTTVQSLKKLYYETGDIAPRQRNTGPDRPVSPGGELWLQALLSETPDLSLAELCEKYGDIYGVLVSTSTMHNTLKRMEYSFKKKRSTTQSGTPPGRRRKSLATSTSWMAWSRKTGCIWTRWAAPPTWPWTMAVHARASAFTTRTPPRRA